jgi:hypothetical protein
MINVVERSRLLVIATAIHKSTIGMPGGFLLLDDAKVTKVHKPEAPNQHEKNQNVYP